MYGLPYTATFSNRADCTSHLLTLCPELEDALDRFMEARSANRDISSMDVRALACDLRTSLSAEDDYAASLKMIDGIRSELRRARPRFNTDLEHALRISFQIHNVIGKMARRQWLLQHFIVRPQTNISRRTRCVADLALRMLPPVDRQRYREEFAGELADLPRRDQAPHALRLLSWAWSQRRELSGKPSRNPRAGLVVVGVVVPGADAVTALCGLDWPAATVAICWTLGLLWILSSKDRTQRLIDLTREARKSNSSTQK
jgi:hypothetical protein